jgi:hypothetical protein
MQTTSGRSSTRSEQHAEEKSQHVMRGGAVVPTRVRRRQTIRRARQRQLDAGSGARTQTRGELIQDLDAHCCVERDELMRSHAFYPILRCRAFLEPRVSTDQRNPLTVID